MKRTSSNRVRRNGSAKAAAQQVASKVANTQQQAQPETPAPQTATIALEFSSVPKSCGGKLAITWGTDRGFEPQELFIAAELIQHVAAKDGNLELAFASFVWEAVREKVQRIISAPVPGTLRATSLPRFGSPVAGVTLRPTKTEQGAGMELILENEEREALVAVDLSAEAVQRLRVDPKIEHTFTLEPVGNGLMEAECSANEFEALTELVQTFISHNTEGEGRDEQINKDRAGRINAGLVEICGGANRRLRLAVNRAHGERLALREGRAAA